jgi:hypothetical protein
VCNVSVKYFKTPFLFDARDQLFCFEPIIQIVAILSLTCFIQPAGQRLHLWGFVYLGDLILSLSRPKLCVLCVTLCTEPLGDVSALLRRLRRPE